MVAVARAFWVAAPGVGEIRRVDLPATGPDDVLVRTVFSGVSRGTETLVFGGQVPISQHEIMRAPHQDGEFSGPVKYGYLNVGLVEAGPPDLLGRNVFCLYPHQDLYVVPRSAVVAVPAGVPLRRAVLAGTVETAVNALWDAAPLIGQRISVVGAGMVGCAVAALLAQIPGVDVELIDVDPARAAIAAALGARFAAPANATGARDLVFHASATSAGLQLAMDLLLPEAVVVDLSWYGNREVRLGLGGAFHSGRLQIRASQVGRIAPAMRGHRTHTDRLALALALLENSVFDSLLTGEADFETMPAMMARLADGSLPGLCHTIRYPAPPARERSTCSA